MQTVLEQPTTSQSFNSFLPDFKGRLHDLFQVENDINKVSLTRGLPPSMMQEILSMKPLSVAVPTAFGGRGMNVSQCLRVLAAASYESLSLSLIFGINIALFLEPFAKYGNPLIKESVFRKFMEENAMGGLMITEPNYGSDALNMRTSYQQTDAGIHLTGQKHWQGLTGAADFWLVAGRKRAENGDLARDVDFFMTDNSVASQQIEVSTLYNNLGLYAIPYGVNEIDVQLPAEQALQPESTGIKLMLDMLHRSRMQFPGMGMGFIKRLLDESLQHCEARKVSGMSLTELDGVKYQLSRIQAAYTLCSGMCSHSSAVSSITFDLALQGIEANSMKALVTDLMQESAQISLQLAGANGYRLDHIAGRSVVDSRPFQIFEGSNEMLYAQIAEGVLKLMRKGKETNLLAFLKQYPATALAAADFAGNIDFKIPESAKQRELIVLGRIIARVICFQYVLQMDNLGFNKQLTQQSFEHMKMDISMFVGQLQSANFSNPFKVYEDSSDWTQFIKA